MDPSRWEDDEAPFMLVSHSVAKNPSTPWEDCDTRQSTGADADVPLVLRVPVGSENPSGP
jgi:hypothetical protein